MQLRRAISIVAAVSVTAGLMTIGDVSAEAASRPYAHLFFASSHISQNTTEHLTVRSGHLVSGTVFYLQRQYGTGHVYKTVEKMPTRNGSFTAPGVAMGYYVYRILGVRAGRTAVVSPARPLFSYGPVSAAAICQRSQYTYFEDYCDPGTVPVGSRVFSYSVQAEEENTGPNQDADVEAQHSSCRAISLSYAVSNDERDDGVTRFGASLTQTNADEQDASSTPNNVGRRVFSISSRDWDLGLWATDGYTVYYAASFGCWSSSGDA